MTVRTFRNAFVACFLLTPASGWAQVNQTTFSNTTAQINVVNNTNATQRVDTFSTEIRARIGSGAFLYDQTFNAAINDSQVQAAIDTARNILNGAGAISVTGPTQISNSVSQVNTTSNTVTNSSSSTPLSVTTTFFIGPQVIQVGNLGVCQSAALNPNPTLRPTLTGCPGGTALTIPPGGINFDTLTLSQVTLNQTTTTTNTFLTAAVYELIGAAPGSVPVTPVPPSFFLALTGLASSGLLYSYRRKK